MITLQIVESEQGFSQLPPDSELPVRVVYKLDGSVNFYTCRSKGLHWLHMPQRATYRFDSSAREVIAYTHPTTPRNWVTDTFRRIVLPVAIHEIGSEILHASAICSASGVMGICGPSMTGKSTLAFGLSRRGHAPFADDSLVFDATLSPVMSQPLPFRFRLRSATADFFDASPTTVVNDALLPLISPASQRVPLSVIAILERTPNSGKRSEAFLLNSGDAFAKLLENAYCGEVDDADRKRRMLNQYLTLTAKIPVYRFCFPPGLEHLDSVLDSLEELLQRN